jgi:hypothetical protein
MDPTELVRLVRFDLLARSRRDPVRDRHMPSIRTEGSMGGASSTTITENDVPFGIRRLAEGVFEITPHTAILQGEYAFYILHKFYAFGID